ncbi:beta strand repeat-containing protein [Gemmatimonas sp.]|uniref:beta strand repeat-containing protein n=1 Tax=Gemmatimonas sp. TaxID=1962908 RepID=UPI003569FAAC
MMPRWTTFLTTPVFALSVAACSSGGDDPITPPPAQSIGVQLSATSGTVARGASGSTTVTLSRVGSYTGSVSITAENLHAGVTARITPTPLTGTASSATTYSLTIPTPAVALTAGSGKTSIVAGFSATVPITITRSNGFSDAVTLAATGLPTGVTATFTPATIAAGSTSSTLTLVVAGNAAPGASTVVVSASGTGVTTQTASLALTLTAASTPAVSLTSTPAAVSIVAGTTGITAIGVSRTGGFVGDVALALEGAPAGVTGAFSTNPVLVAGTSSTLTISTTGAAAPGIYNLTVRGTGTGVTATTTTIAVTVAATPGITVSAAPTALSVAAGNATTTAVTITRAGGYAADVSLAATGLPAGVTAAFAPATPTGATLTSTLTLTTTTAATVGTAAVTVTASGTGVTAQTATVNLTVTATAPTPTYTMAATAVSAQQGANGTSTVTLTRGAGFVGTVNLAVTGLPAGVTATFNPAAVTGTTSTLTLAVGGSVTAGSYTGVITGTATGLANVTANVTANVALTVTAPGGGTGNVNWTFCDASVYPLWFAVQNGTGGAWTRVTSTGTTNRVFSFSAGSIGGVAYAQTNGNGTGTSVTVQYLSLAETTAGASNECVANRATKSLSGTVAGLATAGQSANVGIGGGSATVSFPSTAYTITGVDDGTTDVLAYRGGFNLTTFTLNPPDRGVLRRNVNYAPNSTVPVIDFLGAESFAIANAQYTVGNAGADNVVVTSGFVTANGTAGGFGIGALNGTGTGPFAVYGVPSANTQSGDFHQVIAFAVSGASATAPTRAVIQFNRNLVNRTITLGPLMTQPSVTSLGSSSYVRFSATGAWQSEYADNVSISYQQQSTNSNNWTVTTSRSYAGSGASTWTMALPHFSSVADFSTSWALSSASTTWSSTATGFLSSFTGTSVTEDASLRFGTRTNTIAP